MNALQTLPPRDMTVPAFLDWADRTPGRWQLRDGVPEAMSPAAGPPTSWAEST